MVMKIFVFCFSIFITSTMISQQTTAKSAFLEKWKNSKAYLVGMAEVMPEDYYDFKPTERQMSFQEQLIHIKGNMDWLSTTYFSETEYKKGDSVIPETKEGIIRQITSAFDATSEIIKNTSEESLTETVDFFAGQKSKLQILNLLLDHVTHHRGQLIVYLNLKNIEPPKYVGW